MSVVTVGQYLCVDVTGPRLIDIAEDLIASCDFGNATRLRGKFAGFFVSLISIEDSKGDIEREAYRVVWTVAIVVGFEGRVGCAVGVCELYVCVGNSHAEMGGTIIGSRDESLLLQF